MPSTFAFPWVIQTRASLMHPWVPRQLAPTIEEAQRVAARLGRGNRVRILAR